MHLHENFLENVEQYKEAEAFWNNLFDELYNRHGEVDKWNSWLVKHFANGQPFLDGNPIYSSINLSRRKALKIIQLDKSDEDEADFWEDKSEYEGKSVSVFVIVCCPTEDNIKQLMIEVEKWLYGIKGAESEGSPRI